VKKSKLQNGLTPVRAYAFEFLEFEEEESYLVSYNEEYFKLPSIMNVKTKVKTEKIKTNFILVTSRSYDVAPLKSINIFSYTEFQFVYIHNEDPYVKYSYEPAVIDSFPDNQLVDVSNVRFILIL
jgi:hypothetical protein